MPLFKDLPAYDLTRPAPARLATLRAYARRPGWVRPLTWKTARFSTLAAHRGLESARDGWYTFTPDTLRRQKWADEVEGAGIKHGGWFEDDDCGETVRGLVVCLPHGRYIAGRFHSVNGEYIYHCELFDCPRAAARAGDESARVAAEYSREFDQRSREAMRLADELAALRGRLAELRTLCRHLPQKAQAYRAEACETLERIRRRRAMLRRDFSDVL